VQRPPAPRFIQVTSRPPGAEVWHDGQVRLGTTPLDLPAPSEPLLLEFRLRGHQVARTQVEPGQHGPIVQELRPRPRGPRPEGEQLDDLK
jgi:hypothetical protein